MFLQYEFNSAKFTHLVIYFIAAKRLFLTTGTHNDSNMIYTLEINALLKKNYYFILKTLYVSERDNASHGCASPAVYWR